MNLPVLRGVTPKPGLAARLTLSGRSVSRRPMAKNEPESREQNKPSGTIGRLTAAVLSLLWLPLALSATRRESLAELGAGPPAGTAAALSAADVAVVVNERDPLSEAVGRYYQRQRGIPAANLLRIRFAPAVADLPPARFREIRQELLEKTPARVQVYALAWTAPYRVGCQSITSAFSFGLNPAWCAQGCSLTRMSSYFARGDVKRPWDELRIRPSMLLAARNLQQGQALVQRGMAADGTAPSGTVYFLDTSDYKRNVRIEAYRRAIAVLGRRLQMQLLQQNSLVDRRDVLGYFTGLATVAGIDTNTYRAGAIADHLTSFGGQLTDSSQMSALRWLEAGATASYGTVVEPCAFPAKFPDPGLLLTYYRRGDTLIESYWRSVAMPGQGVFLGEPLARPWPVQ